MEKKFKLVFDDVMLRQLKKLGEKADYKELLTMLFDKMEELGPRAGNLIDSKLFVYEVKVKHPPLRIYYKHVSATDELYVFECELKTSEKKQEKTIEKVRRKAEDIFKSRGQSW